MVPFLDSHLVAWHFVSAASLDHGGQEYLVFRSEL